MSVFNLPRELTISIFSFLPMNEFSKLESVCDDWSRVATSTEFKRTIVSLCCGGRCFGSIQARTIHNIIQIIRNYHTKQFCMDNINYRSLLTDDFSIDDFIQNTKKDAEAIKITYTNMEKRYWSLVNWSENPPTHWICGDPNNTTFSWKQNSKIVSALGGHHKIFVSPTELIHHKKNWMPCVKEKYITTLLLESKQDLEFHLILTCSLGSHISCSFVDNQKVESKILEIFVFSNNDIAMSILSSDHIENTATQNEIDEKFRHWAVMRDRFEFHFGQKLTNYDVYLYVMFVTLSVFDSLYPSTFNGNSLDTKNKKIGRQRQISKFLDRDYMISHSLCRSFGCDRFIDDKESMGQVFTLLFAENE
jgi:hypothetical protein